MTEISFSLIGVCSPSVGALARLARSVSGRLPSRCSPISTWQWTRRGNLPIAVLSGRW